MNVNALADLLNRLIADGRGNDDVLINPSVPKDRYGRLASDGGEARA